jgi:hypothetical protein
MTLHVQLGKPAERELAALTCSRSGWVLAAGHGPGHTKTLLPCLSKRQRRVWPERNPPHPPAHAALPHPGFRPAARHAESEAGDARVSKEALAGCGSGRPLN